MAGKSNVNEQNTDFEKTFGGMENGELIEVLKKRNYYQPEAVRIAIQEAIKRGLLRSKDDLIASEFRVKPLKRKLFPNIERSRNKRKIRQSVARGLLITGVLPVIWAFVRWNAGFSTEGILLFTFGIVWMAGAARLIQKFSYFAIRLMFSLAVLSLIYTGRLLYLKPQLIFMDVFIIAVLYLLVAYGLAFIFRIKE